MDAPVLPSLRLLAALLLTAAFRAAIRVANQASPLRRATCTWRPTHEPRSLKRVEVANPKTYILAVDSDWGMPQAECFTQRAVA